jgi:hypothetical protein
MIKKLIAAAFGILVLAAATAVVMIVEVFAQGSVFLVEFIEDEREPVVVESAVRTGAAVV